MKSLWLGSLAFLVLILSAFGAEPDAPTKEENEQMAQIRKIVDGLHYQTGTIAIGNNLATLTLPEGFRYLDPKDTTSVLVDLWGNPPQHEPSLGMIIPAGSDILKGDAWAVLITYEEDGHIKDNDAESIDYTKLLKDMQASSDEINAERKKQGYEPVHLIGWAAPPRYDAAGKKLYWAKELEFGADPDHTLNYNLRILGRTGVLNLNAIASMKDLPKIEQATPELLAAVSFNSGNRYADFNESTDRVATYGLAALVAGGIATKAGLFKGIWLGILAFKKLIIVGIIGAFAFIKKLFSGRSQ